MTVTLQIDFTGGTMKDQPLDFVKEEAVGTTVRQCLYHILNTKPFLRNFLLTKDNELKDCISVFINNLQIYGKPLNYEIKDNDKLYFIFGADSPG